MNNVKVDGVQMSTIVGTEPGDNFIEMEPVTGVTTKMRRSYTVVFSIDSFNTTTGDDQLPFPSLDNFKQKKFPVFNVTEEIVVDYETFF